MSVLNIDDSLFLVIDIQEKLLPAQFNKEEVQKNSQILAKASNILGIDTIVSEQYPRGLGHTINEIKNNLSADAKFFEKTSFNCTIEEGFLELVKSFEKKQIFVIGMESHICVEQTVNSLIEEGFTVNIVQDAISSRVEKNYNFGLQKMINMGAIPTCTETVLFELLKTAKNPKFKEIQGLIK